MCTNFMYSLDSSVRIALILAVILLSLTVGCQADPVVPYPFDRGKTLALKGNYPEAARQLERELSFRPSPEGFYLLGYCYVRLAEQRGDPRLYHHAEQAFRACLTRSPDHAPAYYELTGLLEKQGRISEAEEMLRQWAARNPNSPEPRLQLARFYHLTGENRAAEDALIEALTLDPKNPRTLVALNAVRRNPGQLLLAEQNRSRPRIYDPTQPELASHTVEGNVTPVASRNSENPTGNSRPNLGPNESLPLRR
jgi:tetratricopeptide (TPR) repeat protein